MSGRRQVQVISTGKLYTDSGRSATMENCWLRWRFRKSTNSLSVLSCLCLYKPRSSRLGHAFSTWHSDWGWWQRGHWLHEIFFHNCKLVADGRVSWSPFIAHLNKSSGRDFRDKAKCSASTSLNRAAWPCTDREVRCDKWRLFDDSVIVYLSIYLSYLSIYIWPCLPCSRTTQEREVQAISPSRRTTSRCHPLGTWTFWEMGQGSH